MEGGNLRLALAAAVLGGVFGTATATVESIEEDVMTIEIEVEVMAPSESVVAHLSFEQERLTLPLLDRGDGVFGLRTELEPKNYSVVFEVVGEGGERSEPTTLARMGAELTPDVDDTTTGTTEDDGGLSEESQSLMWLAIALGAASLSLLAFWALGSKDDNDQRPDTADGDQGIADTEEE